MHATVAIPTRNVADTIGETLAMLDAQTRRPDRVIVVDASNDNTREAIQAAAPGVDYPIDVRAQEGSGVGAAREQLRELAPDGLLVCLDAEVRVEPDWLAEHFAIHDGHDWAAVVSGTWPGRSIGGTKVLDDPRHSGYFVEANCSMPTAVAEKLGGWDPEFRRGCDWDFRIRLAREPHIDAIASDRVAAAPMASNNDWRLHIKKKLNRPSSLPYLRKYGLGYARFHPLHLAGDALGVSAVAAAMLAPVWPPALLWVVGCLMAYAWQFDPPGFNGGERLLASPAIFALGYSTLRAVVNR